MEISSPRTFPAFARTSKESIEIPHVIRRTAATTRRHANSVGTHSEQRGENSQSNIQNSTPHIQALLLLLLLEIKLKPHLYFSCQPEPGGEEALDELQVVPLNQ